MSLLIFASAIIGVVNCRDCLSDANKAAFEGKHVARSKAKAGAARKKSCERNLDRSLLPSATNTVFFGLDLTTGYVSDDFADESCGAYFTQMFHCTGVPMYPASMEACLKVPFTCVPCK